MVINTKAPITAPIRFHSCTSRRLPVVKSTDQHEGSPDATLR